MTAVGESHGRVPCDRMTAGGWLKLRILPLVNPTLQALDRACRFGRNCARGCSARRSCDSAPRMSRNSNARNSDVRGGCFGRSECSCVGSLSIMQGSPVCGELPALRCGSSPLMGSESCDSLQHCSSRTSSLTRESVGCSTAGILAEWNPCFRPVCVDRSVLSLTRGARVRRSFLASLPQE